MQCNWDKDEACSFFQVGESLVFVFVEELVRELVRKLVQPGRLALLQESHQLEAAMHPVPVQELVQGHTLWQESSMNALLAERLVVYLEADLWVKREVIVALYPKCEEQSRMLERRTGRSLLRDADLALMNSFMSWVKVVDVEVFEIVIRS